MIQVYEFSYEMANGPLQINVSPGGRNGRTDLARFAIRPALPQHRPDQPVPQPMERNERALAWTIQPP